MGLTMKEKQAVTKQLRVVDNLRTFKWPSMSDLEELVVRSRA